MIQLDFPLRFFIGAVAKVSPALPLGIYRGLLDRQTLK